MADEAFDTRTLGEALDDAAPPSTWMPQRPLTIHDVPNDVLVSIFAALKDPDWVRRTIPLVHPRWAELYRSKDASPLHEELFVDFAKEVGKAVEAGQGVGTGRSLFVHGSRVISWAEKRAGSVRTLLITGVEDGATKDFSFKEMGRLVAVAAPTLADLVFDFDLYIQSQVRGGLRPARGWYVLPDLKPFWKAVRDSVAPAGRLSTLMVHGADFSEPDIEPLGQLAGSLVTLMLKVFDLEDSRLPRPGDPGIPRNGIGLPRFPEVLCGLTELRCLDLAHHHKIKAIPAKISSLKKLKELNLTGCRLSSLPKELGELSALTQLNLRGNDNLGNTPVDEAFPTALGRMKSLQKLYLGGCGLRAVPALFGELTSLVALDLSGNINLGDAPQHEAFPEALGRMKSLRGLNLDHCGLRAVPAFVGELASLEKLFSCWNENLADAPQHRAFPAALGRMKSLRGLYLDRCHLRTFPTFVGELASLELLDLSENDFEVDAAALDALLKRVCRRLSKVDLSKTWRPPYSAESLAHLKTFKAKLLAVNPGAEVTY